VQKPVHNPENGKGGISYKAFEQKGDRFIMLSRFQKKRNPLERGFSFWWLLAVPAAALSVALGLRRMAKLRLQDNPALVPATGLTATPEAPVRYETNHVEFSKASTEFTVPEMASFNRSEVEEAKSVPAHPPSASEDSEVHISGPHGLKEAEKQAASKANNQDIFGEDQGAGENIPETSDDFRVIEGIGPSISSLLQHSGIYSFRQLAMTSVEDLSEILRKAGLNHLADPTTWPDQARLARDGKWEDLTTMQAALQRGRKVD
jgi:predicted flap endonuclease-1-like 5' DNA nuclease